MTARVVLTGIVLAGVIAGCASVTRDRDQGIGLTAPGCEEPVMCTFTNKRGSWTAQAPGMVTVRRSDDPLRVSCEAGDNIWQEEIEGQRGGRAWGNVLLGGGIGAIVDANTDAHWDYPAAITVPICRTAQGG